MIFSHTRARAVDQRVHANRFEYLAESGPVAGGLRIAARAGGGRLEDAADLEEFEHRVVSQSPYPAPGTWSPPGTWGNPSIPYTRAAVDVNTAARSASDRPATSACARSTTPA